VNNFINEIADCTQQQKPRYPLPRRCLRPGMPSAKLDFLNLRVSKPLCQKLSRITHSKLRDKYIRAATDGAVVLPQKAVAAKGLPGGGAGGGRGAGWQEEDRIHAFCTMEIRLKNRGSHC